MESFAPETSSSSGFSYTPFLIGLAVAALVFLVSYFVIGRAETRPIVQGFQDTAPYTPFEQVLESSTLFTCADTIPEAAQSLQLVSPGISSSSDALRDYKSLLAKISCFKKDISSPQKAITATKDLGFITQQDIQPVADLTARCFAKSVPERDLEIQYEKWDMAGEQLLKTLEEEGASNTSQAYGLLKKALEVSRQTALQECKQGRLSEFSGIEGFSVSRHDPVGFEDDRKKLGDEL